MSGSSRRTLLQGAAGGLATLLLTSCASTAQDAAGPVSPASTTPGSAAASLPSQHVHAVSRDPGNGKLYLATHDGLFRYDPTGPTRVGPVIDLMGFTIVGAGHYLASGHPGPGVDLPHPVGLLEFTNAGQTWQQRSRAGESDFHALTASPAGVLAYDTALRSSVDGTTWQELSIPGEPRWLSTSPGGAQTLATTAAGVLSSTDHGSTWTPLGGAPLLLLTAWMDDTTVVGVAPDGVLFISRDQGRGWAPTGGAVPGVPQALAAGRSLGQREIVLVTDGAIWRSMDHGASLTAYRGGPL